MAPEPNKKPSADEVDEAEPDRKPSADEVDEAAKNDECVVCLDARNNYILMPCGHQCICEVCAERIKLGDPCPVCRTTVEMKGPVYR